MSSCRATNAKDYTIDIEDEGKDIALTATVEGVSVTLRGGPNAMRTLRDELTRAIVCAEVWADADRLAKGRGE